MYKIKSMEHNFCSNIIYLKWRLTYMCNYNCPYCIQTKQKVKEDFDGEKLKEEEARALSMTEKIDNFLSRINTEGKPVVLEIVGGEETLFDLVTLISNIKNEHLAKIILITNGSKPADYFYNLAEYLHTRNCLLNVTMSYHDTQITFDEFTYKATQLNKVVDEFSCEYISRRDNQENVQKFIDTLEEEGIDYVVEPDKSDESLAERMKGELIVTSNFTNRGEAEYYVTYVDDEKEVEKTYDCFAEMLNDKENGSAIAGKAISTKDLYCTINYNTFYILNNGNIRGRTGKNPSCSTETPIDDFVPLERPLQCASSCCTCCDCMSLYKELPEAFNDTSTVANAVEC